MKAIFVLGLSSVSAIHLSNSQSYIQNKVSFYTNKIEGPEDLYPSSFNKLSNDKKKT